MRSIAGLLDLTSSTSATDLETTAVKMGLRQRAPGARSNR
jgi:hypothetical protein